MHEPNIVIKDHADRCCKLINVLVPSEGNSSMKVVETPSKYRLKIKTPRTWGTVPVVAGVLAPIRKEMEQDLERSPEPVTSKRCKRSSCNERWTC